VYDGLSWKGLPRLGTPELSTIGEVELEYRACPCGNALVRVSDRTVAAIEAVLQAAPIQIRVWMVGTPQEIAYAWGKVGLGPDSVRAWLAAGCFDPERASSLEVMQITPELASSLHVEIGGDTLTLGFAFAQEHLSAVETLALVLPLLNETTPEA
jgi:hypothetical protein